jgi:hypothetical protein
VHDALIVSRTPSGTTWRSLDCTNEACCPPEGNPLAEAEEAP